MLNSNTMGKEKFDGRSRPSNKAYDEGWNRIFGSNPIAKEVRTPKFKSQVVKPKKGKGSFQRQSNNIIEN